VYGDPAAARTFLEPLAHHLDDFGVGSIAELFEGDPPFRPRGCIAQAWSVSETLRAWVETARERARMPATPSRLVKASGIRHRAES
jgi:glycogen debranching enzyme